jgi:pimeloyl-ACP methyl ester carboxylesterase
VVPLLEAQGHRVLAPDLLGLPDDQTPVADITLQSWIHQIVGLVEAQPEPVVLVGHSRGGVVISAVAERIPDRISRLVYLTAFLLRDGQCLADVARADERSVIGPNLVIDEAAGTWMIRPEVAVEGFFADYTPEDLEFTFPRLRPEPLFSMSTPIHVSEQRFGRIPRDYIECLQDNAITIECQRRMQTEYPCNNVFTLNTSHSPFISNPGLVVDAITQKVG